MFNMRASWSWRTGSIAGIDIYVHVTFPLILVWIAAVEFMERRNGALAMVGVSLVIALFVCVVFHELGHALVARRYGIRTKNIMILPIGGVAQLERMPDNPREELLVALTGPAVTLLIAVLLRLALYALAVLAPLAPGAAFLDQLFILNLYLAAFNLIPAFPMDGGRVLRSLLALKMSRLRATQIAATLGQSLALIFGLVGFLGNPLLIFIAIFVWFGAAAEGNAEAVKSVLGGVPVSRAMRTEFHTLSPADPITRAVQYMLRGEQHDFPVVRGESVEGVLTRQEVLNALQDQKPDVRVGDAMSKEYKTADPSENLEDAIYRLEAAPAHFIPVMHEGKLVGVLTDDSVRSFLAVSAAEK